MSRLGPKQRARHQLTNLLQPVNSSFEVLNIMSNNDAISVSSDEGNQMSKEDDPLICWVRSKLNQRNRVEVRKRDYLKLEGRGIKNQITICKCK